jgi:hypothetical protein
MSLGSCCKNDQSFRAILNIVLLGKAAFPGTKLSNLDPDAVMSTWNYSARMLLVTPSPIRETRFCIDKSLPELVADTSSSIFNGSEGRDINDLIHCFIRISMMFQSRTGMAQIELENRSGAQILSCMHTRYLQAIHLKICDGQSRDRDIKSGNVTNHAKELARHTRPALIWCVMIAQVISNLGTVYGASNNDELYYNVMTELVGYDPKEVDALPENEFDFSRLATRSIYAEHMKDLRGKIKQLLAEHLRYSAGA